MDKTVEAAIASLMNAYAKYFIEDFAGQVMNHLKGTVSVDTDLVQKFIEQQVDTHFDTDISIEGEQVNPVTRFLYECATFVVDRQIDMPESRDTYNLVRNLPSIHHDDITTLVFNSSILYQKTIDDTLIGVIASDARNTSLTIEAGAKARTTQNETGGVVHEFNWGILSDGLWLNGALMRAFDIAKIFRPGESVVAYYAIVGFNFARNYAAAPVFPQGEEELGLANFDIVLSHADNDVLSATSCAPNEISIRNLLLSSGALAFAIDRWEMGLKDPKALVSAICELSNLAVLLPHLFDVARSMDEDVVSPIFVDRLDSANTAVTLCLAAFEALRETAYRESLIIMVGSQTEDPVTDVFVNSDMLTSYRAAGGEDSDLVHFGAYLDPRRYGLEAPNGGYSVSWALARREDIISEMITSESNRLGDLRNNDAAVIRGLVQSNLRNVTASYAEASGLYEIPNDISQRINDIASRVTSTAEDSSFSLEEEILSLLVQTIANPFLTLVAERFVALASSPDEEVRNNARAFAVASTAIDDAIGFMKAA